MKSMPYRTPGACSKVPFDVTISSLFKLSSKALDEIDRISRLSQEATAFHSREWVESSRLISGHFSRCAFLIVDGVYSGFMFFDVKGGPFGLRTLVSPAIAWATPYGGPVLIKDIGIFALEFIKMCAKKSNCIYANIICSPFIPPFHNNMNGFFFDSTETSVIDLTVDETELFNGIHGKSRNMIRKAVRTGVIVTREDIDAIPVFRQMLESTLGGKGLRIVETNFLNKLYSSSDPAVTLLFSRVNGKPIAGVINLHFRGTSYYWLGASYSEGRTLDTNELLQWQAIKASKAMGSSRYDMVRLDRERLPGISRFKLRFGGSKVDISVITWRSLLWRAARKLKNAQRHK